ncbi:MAG: CBS domain-containing protein [Acidimicrobiales bacterium]|nr:CBS domain-containing protein [Acidimicrobiales bacterium]
MTGIVTQFENTKLSHMELSDQVVVDSDTTAYDTVLAMAEADTSCAFVMSGAEIVGIFTEHDVTHRVVRSPDVWEQPVENFMTSNPKVVTGAASALDGLRLMTEGRFRNLPVILEDGNANLTHYDLIHLASDYLKSDHEETHEFNAEYALKYVDFYGMPSRVPLEVEADESLFNTIELMIKADRGLISVVDLRGILIGEFTQHDVFRKVACRVDDLNDVPVGDYMTTSNMATALPTWSIADGLHEMSKKRHRYLIVVNETGRTVGVVTFRDIADYFQAAFVTD